MEYRSLEDLKERYEFDLEKMIRQIKNQKVKKVLIQFPDGLKPYATLICAAIEERIPNLEVMIFLGSCFGACDMPNTDAPLLIQFGHAPWNE